MRFDTFKTAVRACKKAVRACKKPSELVSSASTILVIADDTSSANNGLWDFTLAGLRDQPKSKIVLTAENRQSLRLFI